jgi:hypothetical protein
MSESQEFLKVVALAIGIGLISFGSFFLGIQYLTKTQKIELVSPILMAYDYNYTDKWNRAIGLTFSQDIHWNKTETLLVIYGIAPNGTDEIVLFHGLGGERLASTTPNLDGTFMLCYKK